MGKDEEISELKSRLSLIVDELEKGGFTSSDNFVCSFYEDIIKKHQQRIKKLSDLLKESDLHNKLESQRPQDITRFKRLLNEITDGLEAAGHTEISYGRCRKQLAEVIRENNQNKLALEALKKENASLREENVSLSKAIASYTISGTVEWSKRNAEKQKNDKLNKQVELLQQCVDLLCQTDVPLDDTADLPAAHAAAITPNETAKLNQNVRTILQRTLRLNSDMSRQLKLSARQYSLLDAKYVKTKQDCRRAYQLLQEIQTHLQTQKIISTNSPNRQATSASASGGAGVVSSQRAASTLTTGTANGGLDTLARLEDETNHLLESMVREGIAAPLHGGGAGDDDGIINGNSASTLFLDTKSLSSMQKDFLRYLSTSRGQLAEAYFEDLGVREVKLCIQGLGSEWFLWTQRDKFIQKVLRTAERLMGGNVSLESAMSKISSDLKIILQCDRVSFWMVDSSANEMWTKIQNVPNANGNNATSALAGTTGGARATTAGAGGANNGKGAIENSRPTTCNGTSGSPLRGSTTTLASTAASQSNELHIPLGMGLVGEAWRLKERVNVPDAYLDPRFDPSVDLKTGYVTRSVLCMPILQRVGATNGRSGGVAVGAGKSSAAGGKDDPASSNMSVVAVIQCINKSTGPFTPQDEFIVRMLGLHAAASVESSRKTTILSWVESRASMLMKTAEALPNIKSLRDLLRFSQERMADIFRVQESQILFVSPSRIRRITAFLSTSHQIGTNNNNNNNNNSINNSSSADASSAPITRMTVRFSDCSRSEGLVGAAVETSMPISSPSGVSDVRYSDIVDLANLRSGWTLHTYPITDPTRGCLAVLQFASVPREVTGTLGFNDQLVQHAKVLGNYVRLLAPHLRRLAIQEGGDWPTVLDEKPGAALLTSAAATGGANNNSSG